MQTPLVSVCVPTYNYGRFLPDCIESVQKQTFSDWELLITDDCSTDRTEEVVADMPTTIPGSDTSATNVGWE